MTNYKIYSDPKIEMMCIAMLNYIRKELDRHYWNKYQKEMVSPFDNCGAPDYSNSYMIVRSYYWGNDEEQIHLPNFETDLVKISWYKHSNRGLHIRISDTYTGNIYELLAETMYKCVEAIEKDFNIIDF